MVIYKTNFGSYRIEALLNGYIFKRYYIGYNLATAKRLFKHDLKQHKGQKQ
jgi:hypothetical protein